MQGDTTEQVHKGGQVNVSNQGGNPVPKDSVAERTKQPLTDFSELGLDMMQDMQEEIKAMEKQLKDKKAALAMAEAKGPEEQDDLSSVSSTDVLVGGQASTFDFSFLPNFLEQELSTPSLPLRGKSRRADLLLAQVHKGGQVNVSNHPDPDLLDQLRKVLKGVESLSSVQESEGVSVVVNCALAKGLLSSAQLTLAL